VRRSGSSNPEVERLRDDEDSTRASPDDEDEEEEDELEEREASRLLELERPILLISLRISGSISMGSVGGP